MAGLFTNNTATSNRMDDAIRVYYSKSMVISICNINIFYRIDPDILRIIKTGIRCKSAISTEIRSSIPGQSDYGPHIINFSDPMVVLIVDIDLTIDVYDNCLRTV